MQPGAGAGSGAHAGGTGDDEAPKDPGARITHQSYTEKDYEGKKETPPISKLSVVSTEINADRS